MIFAWSRVDVSREILVKWWELRSGFDLYSQLAIFFWSFQAWSKVSTLSFLRRLVEDDLCFAREEIDDDWGNFMPQGSAVIFGTLSTMLFHGEVSGFDKWSVAFCSDLFIFFFCLCFYCVSILIPYFYFSFVVSCCLEIIYFLDSFNMFFLLRFFSSLYHVPYTDYSWLLMLLL